MIATSVPTICKFLQLAGILLDTENLDFASMRDTEMTTMLLVGSSSLGRNGFYDQCKSKIAVVQLLIHATHIYILSHLNLSL